MSLLGFPVPEYRDRALARVGAIVDEPRFTGTLRGGKTLRSSRPHVNRRLEDASNHHSNESAWPSVRTCEIVLTPLLSHTVIAHLINLQRGVVGLAMAHLEPGGLPRAFGVGGGGISLVPESTTVAVVVVVAWLIGWSVLGAWRMATRDA